MRNCCVHGAKFYFHMEIATSKWTIASTHMGGVFFVAVKTWSYMDLHESRAYATAYASHTGHVSAHAHYCGKTLPTQAYAARVSHFLAHAASVPGQFGSFFKPGWFPDVSGDGFLLPN